VGRCPPGVLPGWLEERRQASDGATGVGRCPPGVLLGWLEERRQSSDGASGVGRCRPVGSTGMVIGEKLGE